MSRKRLAALAAWAVIAVAAAAGLAQLRQENPSAGGGKAPARLHAEFVKTGLYVIVGGGANSVLRLSGNGLILVDGKLAGSWDELRIRIGKISDQPVRAVVLTSDDADKTGTNEKFLQARAHLVANENLRARLLALTPSLRTGATSPSSASEGASSQPPPLITYDGQYPLRVGGVEFELLHLGNAHTSGDTVVFFPAQRAVALGELCAPVPDPDFSRGGSLLGWGPVLAEVLKLDFDVAVPANGPMLTRPEVEACKAKIDTLTAKATELVGKGVGKRDFNALLNTELRGAGIDPQLSFSAEQIDHLFTELQHGK